jgi:hypothetical protein
MVSDHLNLIKVHFSCLRIDYYLVGYYYMTCKYHLMISKQKIKRKNEVVAVEGKIEIK